VVVVVAVAGATVVVVTLGDAGTSAVAPDGVPDVRCDEVTLAALDCPAGPGEVVVVVVVEVALTDGAPVRRPVALPLALPPVPGRPDVVEAAWAEPPVRCPV
jgi:hypothetical protein